MDDEKTVIVVRPKPRAPEGQKSVVPENPAPKDPPEKPKEPEAKKLAEAAGKKPAPEKKAKGQKPQPPKAAQANPKPKRDSHLPAILLGTLSLFLILAGTTLTFVYFQQAQTPVSNEVTAQDLQAEVVAVEDQQSADEDEALIKAAIAPRVLSLSGDPVIIRQLSSAPRQLLRLDQASHVKAASELGITSDVFRFKEALDTPSIGFASGAAGSQEDIATLQQDAPPQSADTTIGSSVINANAPSEGALREFAQEVKTKSGVSEFLSGLGMAPARAKLADAAFQKFYGRATLQKNDRIAVRAVTTSEKEATLDPVQISIYSAGSLLGSVAVDDLDAFAEAADPWAGQDIFKTELLPTETKPEDRPRLLDAIYAAALRNRLPTTVTGEAIMLLSRSQDLEQKVQDGDTITLIYSPAARDSKTGLGRVIYVGIGRTTGSLDCYAFQAQAGAQFECLSAEGESSVPEGGMIKPVNGVLVAKFGPQDQASGGDKMNFGVDWTAPEGSPVVAAFDGDVVSAGEEGNFGKVIRLSHADGNTSMYAYLQRFEPGVTVGAHVKAGQTIGYVGTPASSREPRLHFELRKNDVPVDPVAEMQPGVGSGGVVDQFVHRIITIESGNRCNARNPLSTAVGLGQFINSTWMTTLRLHRPDLLAGRSQQQVLDLRLDCNVSRSMTTAFTRDNAAVLRQAGRTVTPGNLYLAHFLGVGGAVKALGGDQNRLISDVFGAGHVRANPFEAGKSLAYLVSWAAKKMGGAAKAPAATQTADATKSVKPAVTAATAATPADAKAAASPAAQPQSADSAAPSAGTDVAFARYDSNPMFTKLKNAVVTLLR